MNVMYQTFNKSKGLLLIVGLLTLAILIFNVFFYVVAQYDNEVVATVFNNFPFPRFGRTFVTNFTPSSWINYAWTGVYIYQFVWLLVLLALVLYLCSPPKFPVWILLSFSCALILEVVWYAVLTRALYAGAFIIILFVFLCVVVPFYFMAKLIECRGKETLPRWGLITARVLFLNGIGMLTAWLFVLVFYTFDVLLVFGSNLDAFSSAISMATVMFALIILYFSMDLSLQRRYLKYIITPYIVWLWTFSAIVDRYRLFDPNGISTGVPMLSLVASLIISIFLIMKIICIYLTIYRKCKRRCEFFNCAESSNEHPKPICCHDRHATHSDHCEPVRECPKFNECLKTYDCKKECKVEQCCPPKKCYQPCKEKQHHAVKQCNEPCKEKQHVKQCYDPCKEKPHQKEPSSCCKEEKLPQKQEPSSCCKEEKLPQKQEPSSCCKEEKSSQKQESLCCKEKSHQYDPCKEKTQCIEVVVIEKQCDAQSDKNQKDKKKELHI